MLYFLLGILVGMIVALLTTKHTIKKTGAGNMRVCEQCRYKEAYTKPLIVGEDEDIDD